MIKKRIVLSVVVAGSLLAGATVYSVKEVNSAVPPVSSPQVATVTQTTNHSDRPIYTNINDLRMASDLIFVGTVEGIDGVADHDIRRFDSHRHCRDIYTDNPSV
jgi:hypothetical protein